MADVVREAAKEVDGELYDSPVLNDSDRVVANLPAMQCTVGERAVNVVLADVPGSHDHFSIIMVAYPQLTLHLRTEARWDWIAKSFGQLEDLQVGVPRFDRKFVVGGKPASKVQEYLRRADVEGWIDRLGEFHNLAASTGFFRATFPLEPDSRYTVDDLRKLITSMLRLAEVAENKPPAVPFGKE